MAIRAATALALAASASAFLLPPGVNIGSKQNHDDTPNLAKALSLEAEISKHSVVTVPCSSCAFPTEKAATIENADGEEEPAFHIAGGANSLMLDVNVSEDGKAVLINGKQIWPDMAGIAGMTTYQVPSQASVMDIESGEVAKTLLQITGSGLKMEEAEKVTEEGDEMVGLKFFITELEGQAMDVEGLALQLLQSDGEWHIVNTETVESPMPPRFKQDPKPTEEEGEKKDVCATMAGPKKFLCEMIDTVESHLPSSLKHHSSKPTKGKGCAGKPKGFGAFGWGPFGAGRPHHHLPGHIRPHFPQPGDKHHGGPPHWLTAPTGGYHHGPHHGPHGPHHHHGEQGAPASFLRAFVQGLVAVMVPVMMGITVGIVVSVLGLMTGRLIGFLWFRIARGGQRGYASVAQQEESMETGEGEVVGKASMESTDTLPRYEDAPAYEEVTAEKL